MNNNEKSGWLVILLTVALFFLFGLIVAGRYGISAREASKRVCINNLRQIAEAKTSWALEQSKGKAAEVSEDALLPFFKVGLPRCLARGIYTLGRVGEPPRCSITNHVLP